MTEKLIEIIIIMLGATCLMWFLILEHSKESKIPIKKLFCIGLALVLVITLIHARL